LPGQGIVVAHSEFDLVLRDLSENH
jgi:hypothetical protein